MNKNRQTGLSIIELIVAMVISLLVLGGVYKIFQANSQTYRVQEELSRVQENGRFALQLLARDIRMAGYLGCATKTVSITNTLDLSATSDFLWGNFSKGIYGYEAQNGTDWNEAPDASIINPLGGSDIITIRRAGDNPMPVTHHPGGSPPGSADIQVDDGTGLAQGDILFVSDCSSQAAIFQVTNANPETSNNIAHNTGTGVPGNTTKELGKEFEGGEVVKINTISYYVRENNSTEPSLYRRIGDNDEEELVEGVESMQVLYGEDSDNDGAVDHYVAADAVGTWADVMSVRVGLLLRTVNEMYDIEADKGYHTILGVNATTPTDHRLRRVVETTIGIRNRMR